MSSRMKKEVPIIDIAVLFDSGDDTDTNCRTSTTGASSHAKARKQEVVQQVVAACKEWGFFQGAVPVLVRESLRVFARSVSMRLSLYLPPCFIVFE